MLKLVQHVLAEESHSVIPARDGTEALAVLATGEFDIEDLLEVIGRAAEKTRQLRAMGQGTTPDLDDGVAGDLLVVRS